jgi:FkbM family methyltransferase
VQLAFQIAGTHWLLDSTDVAQQLVDRYPRFSRTTIPVREDAWGFAAQELRLGLDYLRYLAPAYRDATKLRERAERGVPEALLRRSREGALATPLGRRLMAKALRTVEHAIPTDPSIDAFLEANRPDVLALTPLIEPGAPQAEYLRSARSLGIRTALCVASWDNLTNKGLIHGGVDLVAVWNRAMKREAIEFHGVASEDVVVTGAQPFDHWFTWQPSTTRDAFCQRVGLPADKPYFLYLCSSRFIAPDEAAFVRTWLTGLRAASPRLREAGVLIRPHPQNADQWRGFDLSPFGPAVVWPPTGATPSHDASRAEYFDSIYHCAAAVGVNTTAEIESAIVGRRVFTVLAPEFRDTQGGTLHFEHLRRAEDGLVQAADSLAEHFAQLDASLASGAGDGDRCRRFVESFVRPHGIDVAATPRLVDALERLARKDAPAPAHASRWAPLARAVVRRRGERLQREAFLGREMKAARARRRKKPSSKSAVESASAPVAPVESTPTRAEHWKVTARAFKALGYHDRVRFAQATFDQWPGELLLETARPERLDYPDADIWLRVLSKKERERLKACAKEPFTIEWIHQWIRPGEVLFDIGANVGAYSLVAAKKPGGGATVFAFEASYANVSSLSANVAANGVADSVIPVSVALADSEALGVLALRALEPGAARHTLGDGPSDEGPILYRQPVMTWRLDELIERFGLPQPHHVKLDVDGGELAVIAGAARTLAASTFRSLLIEIGAHQSDEVTAALARLGLSLHTKVDVVNTAGEHRVWYGLFTRAPLADGGPEARQVSR